MKLENYNKKNKRNNNIWYIRKRNFR